MKRFALVLVALVLTLVWRAIVEPLFAGSPDDIGLAVVLTFWCWLAIGVVGFVIGYARP